MNKQGVNYNIKFREFVCNPAFLTVDFMVVFRTHDDAPENLIAENVVFMINGVHYTSCRVNCSIQTEFGFIRLLLPIEKTGPLCDIDFDWQITGQYRVIKNGLDTVVADFIHAGQYSPNKT